MSEIFFGIPSYKRPDAQPTLDMLLRLGIKTGNIIISVQTQEDREAYQRYADTARVIYRSGKNKSANANTILDLLPDGSKLVLLVVYGFGKIVAQLFKLVKLSCFRAR